MQSTTFANLFVIAAAPVIEPTQPLQVAVTKRGLQTLAAHNAPVPRLRARSTVPADLRWVEEGVNAALDAIDLP